MKLQTLKLRTHHEQGYTLLELLLYMTIMGTLLTSVVFFYSTAVDARVKTQTILEVNQQGTALMDYMTQTIRNATSVTAPAPGATGPSLTLVVPEGPLSPTIFNLYTASPNTVQVKEGSNSFIPLTSNKVQISDLTFKNVSRPSTPGSIQISFKISRVNPNNMNVFEYQKTFTTTAEVAW